MRLNNTTKLILTIICMVICLLSMFIAIYLASKNLIMSDDSNNLIQINNVEADLDLYVTGQDTSSYEDGLDYYQTSAKVTKEMGQTDIQLKIGELRWKRNTSSDTLRFQSITMFIAITNTCTDGSYLTVSLQNLSPSASFKDRISRDFYDGVGIEDENTDTISGNGMIYKGIRVDDEAKGVPDGAGIPAGYTYVLKIVYSLTNYKTDFSIDDNLFVLVLGSQTTTSFTDEADAGTETGE